MPSEGKDSLGVSLEGADVPAGGGIPEADGSVAGARGDDRLVGMPCESVDVTCVTAQESFK